MTNTNYRTDIQGLRAIAVLSVFLFHLGFLNNGFLGVDIFFVISGYLITGTAYRQTISNNFSILKFYDKRIRRIFPLLIFATGFSLLIGTIVMLPDDLENLCQSVIASNFSLNNILMYITSNDYWAAKNEYKPLMHTWSLGIEEQFYWFYPLLFVALNGKRISLIIPVLIILTFLSICCYFSSNDSQKFYFIQNRFFELSIGGICAICSHEIKFYRKKISVFWLSFIFLIIIISVIFNLIKINHDAKIFVIVLSTASLLLFNQIFNTSNSICYNLLSHNLLVYIGKISFSIYIWHQIILSFTRYFIIDKITPGSAIIIIVITILLSNWTYIFIEDPFRSERKINRKNLFFTLLILILVTSISSFYIYIKGGIIRNVPELGILENNRPSKLNFFSKTDNIHAAYNEKARTFDRPFSIHNVNHRYRLTKVLVIGNSFGRDIVNVLLKSSFKSKIEISYSDLKIDKNDLIRRYKEADFIFFGSDYPGYDDMKYLKSYLNKIWIFGVKNFGVCNGIPYNRRVKNYQSYRIRIISDILTLNDLNKQRWGRRYIDLISIIADQKGRVLVYTPDGKFISQDCIHFTEAGAQYYAELLQPKFDEIFGNIYAK